MLILKASGSNVADKSGDSLKPALVTPASNREFNPAVTPAVVTNDFVRKLLLVVLIFLHLIIN
jgi:hypothetical protein